MKCFVVVCRKPAKWEGTLAAVDQPQYAQDVRYCDEHAWTQVNRTPQGMKMTLTPIGQEAKS